MADEHDPSELCGLTVPTYVEGFHDADKCAKMRYRSLGSTGNKVSILSLGGSALGSVYRETNLDDSIAVVQESIKAGINLIDAAPWYGHGKAEEVLGKAFAGVPRESFYYNTKVCRYNAEPLEMFDFRAERTLQSIDESLARTGLEYIDCIQVHDPEFTPNLDVIVNETIPAMQKAKDAGKVRAIGMTGYPLHIQKELIERSEKNGIKLDTSLVYCHYSMNDATLMKKGGFKEFLDTKGMGCINASPISMGLLTARGPPGWHPANHAPHIITACKEAGDYCAAKGVDYSKLAMHFTLRCKDIPTTLVTSANPKRMASNIAAVHETLSELEEQTLADCLADYFPWNKEESKATWVDIEPQLYWTKMGQELECLRLYPGYKGEAPSSHEQGK